ncbi:MAG: hypothetical protein PHQ86_02625 [Dehalococcoidales bacterium]|nr:hypothetical protein [Dehalococcoidales bacterium]
MIYWAQLFHFYQPPTQIPSILKKICDESYRPLIEVLEQYSNAKATVNINGVLIDMLRNCGHTDVLNGLKKLAEKGQIEFTATGKYHPILPLIPPEEIKRQIELNQRTGVSAFGDVYKPNGFFPPEMAYSRAILPAVIEAACKWIIISGIACPIKWPVDVIHQIEHEGKQISVFFRDDIISNKISFQELDAKNFLENLKNLQNNKENIYVITAMDAETYGHHIKDWEELFLAEVYEQLEEGIEIYTTNIQQKKVLATQHANLLQDVETAQQVQTVTISQLMEIFKNGAVIDPRPSSWSTSSGDIEMGNPYPLWQDKDNEIHNLLWEHLAICNELCLRAIKIADNDESKRFSTISRGLLDRTQHSDPFWWASRRPMWDINLVHMGLIEQWRAIVNAYHAINSSGADRKIKSECYYKVVAARDIRNKVVDRLFIT